MTGETIDMLSAREVNRIAAHLVGQRLRRENVAYPDGLTVTDSGDIYRIQTRLTEILGGGAPPSAFKISWIPAGLLAPEGDCWFSGVPAGRLFESGTAFESTQYRRLGFECEVACRIGIGRDGQPVPISIMPALELIEEHHTAISKASISAVVASSICNSAFVLGPETEGWPDVTERIVRVTRNGATVMSGPVRDYLDPDKRLRRLLARLPELGWHLTDGMIVSTGMINKDNWFETGDEIVGEIEGLGRVSASIR